MFASFVKHLERFGCYSMKQQHGTIVGIHVMRVPQYSTILSSLSSFLPCLEFLGLRDISAVDVTHFVPLFSSLHKLVSLKVFIIIIKGDEGVLPCSSDYTTTTLPITHSD